MDVVLQQYRVNKKQGWGAMAQSLGIKPGSPEFKALKAGELGWDPPGAHGKTTGGHDDAAKGGKETNGKAADDKGAKNKGKKH
jgi:hypothetical protein